MHPAKECPGLSSGQFKDFLQKFSPEYLSAAKVKLISAYIDHSCLTRMTEKDHLTTFIMDADSAERIQSTFSPIPMQVRQVIPWSESEASKIG
jgi:hypothetical protein